MKRMLWAIVVTVVTILLGTAALPSAVPIEVLSGPGYTYDNQGHPAVLTFATTERGPPSVYHSGAISNDFAIWWQRVGAFRERDSHPGSTYNDRAAAPQVAKTAVTTSEVTPGIESPDALSTRSQVAAKSGEGFWSSRLAGMNSERGAIGLPGRAGAAPLTTAQATQMADRVGYQATNQIFRGQRVFTNGKNFIVQDIDSHSGGLWKMADTIKGLGSKSTRTGTYDYNLNYIGP